MIDIKSAILANLQAVMGSTNPEITPARYERLASIMANTFQQGSSDLYGDFQTAIDRHFNSDDRTSPRWYFHTTTVERFADIAIATLQKHQLIDDDHDYTWWDISLPA